MGFLFEKQNIDGVILIKADKYDDLRGSFLELYKKDIFIKNGIDTEFIQDNISYSKYMTLRGLHYQAEPYAQAKLIYCIEGKIQDIIVDLRKNSPSYKKHLSLILSAEEHNMLFIPKGFAHGFLSLSRESIVSYKTDSYYNKDSQRGIIYNDEDLCINWMLNGSPILTNKDKILPKLSQINTEELW